MSCARKVTAGEGSTASCWVLILSTSSLQQQMIAGVENRAIEGCGQVHSLEGCSPDFSATKLAVQEGRLDSSALVQGVATKQPPEQPANLVRMHRLLGI